MSCLLNFLLALNPDRTFTCSGEVWLLVLTAMVLIVAIIYDTVARTCPKDADVDTHESRTHRIEPPHEKASCLWEKVWSILSIAEAMIWHCIPNKAVVIVKVFVKTSLKWSCARASTAADFCFFATFLQTIHKINYRSGWDDLIGKQPKHQLVHSHTLVITTPIKMAM